MYSAIYGAGVYGSAILEAARRQGRTIDFFIDEFTAHRTVEGLEVKRIADCGNLADIDVFLSVAPPAIASGAQADPLCATLTERGFAKVFPYLEVLREIPGILQVFAEQNLLWMRSDADDMVNADAICKLRSQLSDETSRKTLDALVKWRKSMSPDDYVMPDGEEEYFPTDVPVFHGIDTLRFIDGGAYTGDTVKAVCAAYRGTIDYIASFEPDKNNLKALRDTVLQTQKQDDRCRTLVYQLGIWSETTTLSFVEGQGSSSAIAEDGAADARLIPVAALDDLFMAMPPNYIKFDIEGAESEALLGAKTLIETHKPALAVCVYHKPADLWELPAQIKAMAPSYRLYLRQHGHMGVSTVLYALP